MKYNRILLVFIILLGFQGVFYGFSYKEFADNYFNSVPLASNFELKKPDEEQLKLYKKYRNTAFYNDFVNNNYKKAAKEAMLYLQKVDPEDSVAFHVARLAADWGGVFKYYPIYNPFHLHFRYLSFYNFVRLLEVELFYKSKNPNLYYFYAFHYPLIYGKNYKSSSIVNLMIKKGYQLNPDSPMTKGIMMKRYFNRILQDYKKEFKNYLIEVHKKNPNALKIAGYKLMIMRFLYKKHNETYQKMKNFNQEIMKIENSPSAKLLYDQLEYALIEEEDTLIEQVNEFYAKRPYLPYGYQINFLRFYFIATPSNYQPDNPFESGVFKNLAVPPFFRKTPAGMRFLNNYAKLIHESPIFAVRESAFLPANMAVVILDKVLSNAKSDEIKCQLFLSAIFRFAELNKKYHLKESFKLAKKYWSSFKSYSDFYYALGNIYLGFPFKRPLNSKAQSDEDFDFIFTKAPSKGVINFLFRAKYAKESMYANRYLISFELGEAALMNGYYNLAFTAYSKSLYRLSKKRLKTAILRMYHILESKKEGTALAYFKKLINPANEIKSAEYQLIKKTIKDVLKNWQKYKKRLPVLAAENKKGFKL